MAILASCAVTEELAAESLLLLARRVNKKFVPPPPPPLPPLLLDDADDGFSLLAWWWLPLLLPLPPLTLIVSWASECGTDVTSSSFPIVAITSAAGMGSFFFRSAVGLTDPGAKALP